jgi:two-component system response regulator DesR
VIRVLLVHDARLVRSAIADLMGKETDIEVSAASWDEAPRRLGALRPDVLVADMECAGSATLAAVAVASGCDLMAGAGGAPYEGKRRKSRAAAGSGGGGGSALVPPPGCALVALLPAGRPGLLRRAHDARATGFVDKDASPQRLLEAIRRAAAGERWVDPSLAHGFLQAADMPLTRRELSVLSLAAEGASTAEIARVLHLCNGTVRNYMAAITRKTGARNRVDAIRISRTAGWV